MVNFSQKVTTEGSKAFQNGEMTPKNQLEVAVDEVAKNQLNTKNFVGEAIRRTVFSCFGVVTVIGAGLFSVIASPLVLLSALIQRFLPSSNPLHTVASFIKSAAREAFSLLVLTAYLPLDLEKLDPTKKECVQGKLPVLLVHGFLGASNNWIFLRRRLVEAGVKNIFSVNLGDPRLGIDTYTEVITEKIKEIQEKTGSKQVILIGHSMGGLVCKNYAHANSQTVRSIITIGSPLKGTQTARFGSIFSDSARDMVPGSDFLTKMENFTEPSTQIASSCDEIVIPNSSAQGGKEEDSVIDDAGHVGLLFSGKTVRALKIAIGSQNEVPKIH
jgi:pimeloyl-ACP methyl ester carboxylesterase